MEKATVNRFSFNRAELRAHLIRVLENEGIEIRGETRLVLGLDSVAIEEYSLSAVSPARGQTELELKK